MNTTPTYTYADLSSSLALDDETRLVDIKYDVDVIQQSILRLMSTLIGEEVRSPLGTTLIRYLHQPMSKDMADDIQYELNQAIKKFEPRVVISNLKVTPHYDDQRYYCEFVFNIPDLGQKLSLSKKIRAYGV